jgi:hypothetical protein
MLYLIKFIYLINIQEIMSKSIVQNVIVFSIKMSKKIFTLDLFLSKIN